MPDPTERERIMRALVTLWDAPSKPDGLSVHRSPGRALQKPQGHEGHWLALAVLPDPDETETALRMDHSDGLERTLGILAALRASDADIEALHALADEAYAWLVTQVALDRQLGALCENIRESGTPRWEVQDLDGTYVRIDVRWEVTFWTSEDDPRLPPELP